MGDINEKQEEQETKEKKPRGYWNNYENCWNEALKYHSRKEFKEKCNSCYEVARKNKWLDDYTWIPKPTDRKNGYWNYETCYDAAKSCHTIKDMALKFPGGLDKARDNGWLSDYTWFVDGRILEAGKRRVWDYSSCMVESKKYIYLKDFRELSASAYGTALKNGWLDEYVWLKRVCFEKGHWCIYENVLNEALKYKTRSEFAKGSSSACNSARKHGWLETFDFLEDRRFDLYKDKIDSVYVYEFIEQHAAYIGRTLMRTQKQRDKHHIFVLDAVSIFAKENNMPVPEMKILEDNLTLKEGTEREAFYIEKYKNEGWNVLNKAKAGAIGSLNHNKYTYSNCYEEAKRYKTYKDFVKNSRGYYRVAYNNGWIDDYTWLVNERRKHNYWGYETCMNAAKLCKSMVEFREKYAGGYDKARDNGWLKDYTWLVKKETKPVGYWTKKHCLEEGKKYKTKIEWLRANQMSYKTARENGWLDECTWLEKPSRKKKNTQELTSEE